MKKGRELAQLLIYNQQSKIITIIIPKLVEGLPQGSL